MKYVLITGASGGLGIHLSKYLLDKGYFVIMLYHNNSKDVLKLNNKYNNSIVYKIDITNDDEVTKLHEYLLNKNIKVDILINNAAIDNTCDINLKDKSSFINTYLVNTYAPFILSKTFINEVKSIVNISSDNTIDSYDMVSIEYDLSKSALNMLTKEFAREYKDVHINAICFGWLDTKMNNLDDDIKKYIKFVSFDKAISEIEKLIETNKTGEIKVVK